MAGWFYLACLLISIAGMAILDWRFHLFWFDSPSRAAVVHAGGWLTFLAWDLVGIGTGIFHRGDTAYMTGFDVAPHLPVEELFFLFFLCWLTMNLYTGLLKVLGWFRYRAAAGSKPRHP